MDATSIVRGAMPRGTRHALGGPGRVNWTRPGPPTSGASIFESRMGPLGISFRVTCRWKTSRIESHPDKSQ